MIGMWDGITRTHDNPHGIPARYMAGNWRDMPLPAGFFASPRPWKHAEGGFIHANEVGRMTKAAAMIEREACAAHLDAQAAWWRQIRGNWTPAKYHYFDLRARECEAMAAELRAGKHAENAPKGHKEA